MQFVNKRELQKLAGERSGDHYPHSLQFYQSPPTENISLVEFETFAVERLKLLKTLENLGVSYVKSTDQYKSKLEGELRKLKFPYRFLQDGINNEEYDQRRKDHISHFILRLAYCQSEDLRRWFIQQEMDLFRFRFGEVPKEKVQEFLKSNDLEYVAISEDEKKMHEDDLINSSFGFSMPKLEDNKIYKVPFEDALDLIRPRKVFLFKGFAFIPHNEIVAIVLNDFRAKLSKALAFDKVYAYSIRHNYGKEGKRTDYTPYSCMKIIMSNPPSQGDYHGCPFRHSDPELLKQKLQSFKVSSTGISEILDLVKGMHYQLACQKYFELTHNVDDCGFSLNHPNQYFAESQKLLAGGREIKKESNLLESNQAKTASEKSTSSASTARTTSTQPEEIEDLEKIFSEY
ncbi:hypothetical protein FKM82_011124 [Ascaphus truei]